MPEKKEAGFGWQRVNPGVLMQLRLAQQCGELTGGCQELGEEEKRVVIQ